MCVCRCSVHVLFGTQFPAVGHKTTCKYISRSNANASSGLKLLAEMCSCTFHSKQRKKVLHIEKSYYMFADCVMHWNSFATVINWCAPILSVSVILYLCLHLMLTALCLLLCPHQMGAYHTIELELNRKFTLAKKSWDSILLERIGKPLLLFVLTEILVTFIWWQPQHNFTILYLLLSNTQTGTSHLHASQCF